MAALETPEINPSVQHLFDLLKWVREGRVRVPRFQRSFVWTRPKMLDLFDSVRRQFPIGTLLFWDPKGPHPTFARLGPLMLKPVDGSPLLLLDGQQRLTTLAGTLLFDELGATADDDEDPGRWKIYFDASREPDGEFVHCDPRRTIPESWVAVSELMDLNKLIEAGTKWLSESSAAGRTEAQRWVKRLQDVGRALATYKIPIVTFSTHELDTAVNSFGRLNRAGQTVGADELYTALTWENKPKEGEFRLADHIDAILREIARRGFGKIDRTFVLRTILALADLDPYRSSWKSLGEELKKQTRKNLPRAISEAERGLLRGVDFLRELGIWNARLLPYGMLLVALGAFFGRCDSPGEKQKSILRRLVWVSSFAGWFGGTNPARVRALIEELRDRITQETSPRELKSFDLDMPAESFPERYDLRSARLRTLLCVLLRNGLRGPDGQHWSTDAIASRVLERGPAAFSTIFSSLRDKTLRSSPANRIFDVQPERKGQARNWLQTVTGDEWAELARAHVLPLEGFPFPRKAADEYVRARLEQLIEHERAFMLAEGVTPSSSDGPGPIRIDVEDDPPTDEDRWVFSDPDDTALDAPPDIEWFEEVESEDESPK